jgi:class 3 adenylate cyclase/CHASE2 domain-containing sensor protein
MDAMGWKDGMDLARDCRAPARPSAHSPQTRLSPFLPSPRNHPPMPSDPSRTSRSSTDAARVSRAGPRTDVPKPRRQRPEPRPAIGVLVALALFPPLVLLFGGTRLLEMPEGLAFDAAVRWRARYAPQAIDPRVILVGIDRRDYDLRGEDLARRQAHQALVLRMQEWGAATVAFDIFFEEERELDALIADGFAAMPVVLGYHFQRESSDVLPAGDMPADIAPYEEMARTGTDADALLLAAQRHLKPYAEQLRTIASSGMLPSGERLAEEDRIAAAQGHAWATVVRRRMLERWFWLRAGKEADAEHAEGFEAMGVRVLSPPLMEAAAALGFANVEKGIEPVVRRAPLVYRWRGRVFPHLSLAAVLQFHGVKWEDVRIRWGDAIEFEPRDGGTVRIPIDGRGLYLVNWHGGEDFLNAQPTVTVVLQDTPEFVAERERRGLAKAAKGAIVLVGETVTGGTDTQPIPLQAKYPMVGLHANIIDNVLRRDFLRPVPPWGAALVAAGLGLVLALAYARLPGRRALALVPVLAAAQLGAAWALFLNANVVLPVVGVLGCLLLAAGSMTAYTVGVVERERRLVREIFAKTVSPKICEELLRNYSDEALWGAEREVTVLFVDIRGYTALSEQADADALLRLLDRFYDTVSEAVFRHDGQVNKFIGDAVLALFGALPDEPANHAERALRAAVQVQRAMSKVADDPAFRGLGLRIETGAGINTGVVTVGIVGRRESRIEYTAIGDNVNVASRLQGLAAERQIAIGGETVAALGGPDAPVFAELGLDLDAAESLQVKGRRKAVDVFRARLASTT